MLCALCAFVVDLVPARKPRVDMCPGVARARQAVDEPTSVRPHIVATLPIRSFHDGKRRLAARLSSDQRCRLIVYLLTAVVYALRESGVVDMISVVSGDDSALSFGQSLRLVPIREEEAELNGALRTASAWARASGARAHLIVLPDLPLLRGADIRAVVRSAQPEDGIVACPDRKGTGTNVLFLRPCGVIPPMFGPQSFERHLRAAWTAGKEASIYDSPGTRWDIDTPDDLDALGLTL